MLRREVEERNLLAIPGRRVSRCRKILGNGVREADLFRQHHPGEHRCGERLRHRTDFEERLCIEWPRRSTRTGQVRRQLSMIEERGRNTGTRDRCRAGVQQ